MNFSKGWIKIPRDIECHWLWLSARQLQWWLKLVFLARLEPEEVIVRNQVVRLERGQLESSVRRLTRLFECAPNTTLAFLKILENAGMIRRITMNKITIITIEDFDLYCGDSRRQRQQKKTAGAHPDSSVSEENNEAEKSAAASPLISSLKNEQKGVKNELKNASQKIENSETPEQSLKQSLKQSLRHIYKDIKKEKKERKDSLTHNACACEKGGSDDLSERLQKRENDFFNEMMNSPMYWENLSISLGAEIKDLKEMAARWKAEILAVGENHSSLKEFKIHFKNWARLELRNNKFYQNNGTYKQKQADGSAGVRSGGRRAADISNIKPEDFQASF